MVTTFSLSDGVRGEGGLSELLKAPGSLVLITSHVNRGFSEGFF